MRQRSVSGAAIDRLEESCSFQNVNRLRYLRLNKLPFPRRYDSLVFGGLVIHRGLALPILILIVQQIPPVLIKLKLCLPVLLLVQPYGRASTFT